MAVTVYFATNRNPIGNPPTDFGPKLSSHEGLDLRFGSAEVELVFKDGGGADEDASTVRTTVAKERLTTRAHSPTSKNFVFGSDEVLGQVRKKMVKRERDSILYIHGFANSFKSSIVRAAELKHQLGADANLAVFSWPSDGEVFLYSPYIRDREDARASGLAMAKAIRILACYLHSMTGEPERREIRRSLLAGEDVPIGPCEHKIHLLAHSMGNYALRFGVVALRNDFRGQEVKLFDKVFLMAADADDDALSDPDKMAFLTQISEKISVYQSRSTRQDRRDRCFGRAGPRLRQHKSPVLQAEFGGPCRPAGGVSQRRYAVARVRFSRPSLPSDRTKIISMRATVGVRVAGMSSYWHEV